jgi:hypothetical protein
MPILGALLLAIDVALVFHASKTGRCQPWCYIILMVPGIGALAYVVVELVPEWLGTYQGQKARARIGKALNPEKTYRTLKDELEIANTIANREALAEECFALGRFDEAKEQYDAILTMPLGDAPGTLLGRARAEFGLGRFTEARTTLDDLRSRWPDWESADGHLLYARTLEGYGRLDEANAEYITPCPPIMRAPSRGCATASRCVNSATKPRRGLCSPMWCCICPQNPGAVDCPGEAALRG